MRMLWVLCLLPSIIFNAGHAVDEQHGHEDDFEEELSAWSEDLDGWPIPLLEKATSETSRPKNIFLERDAKSGCVCRISPGLWALCFGVTCEEFPKELNISVSPLIRVKTTGIKVIRRGDLSNLKEMQELEIEGNPSLERLEPGCFQGLEALANLSISFNAQLKNLETGAFDGLTSLRELRLTKNGFQRVSDVAGALSPSSLPALLRLGLSENQFRYINENELEPLGGSSLRELSLMLCQLDHVHPNALKPLTNLRVLRLGENSLEPSVLASLIESLNSTLEKLDLYRSGFRRRPPLPLLRAVAKRNVTELILGSNQFERLSVDSFPRMPWLWHLDLRGVVCLNIETGTFNGMPQLRSLLLGHNKLARVEPGVLPPSLVTLDLSSNSADRLFPSYFYLGEGGFQNNTNLTSLNLSFNRLIGLSKGTFLGLNTLKFLSLKNCTLFRLGSGCFSPLRNLIFLDLQNNRFPSSELNIESMLGLSNLKVLQLGGCRLENILGSPFSNLISLEYLDLRNNGLVALDPTLLSPLRNLIGVDLSDNVLSPWNSRRLFYSNEKLRILFLSMNKLSTLTGKMLDDFSTLSRLDFSGNPFLCDCRLFTAKTDFAESSEVTANYTNNATDLVSSLIHQLRKSSALCFSPDRWRDASVADFLESSVSCPIPYEEIPYVLNSSHTLPQYFYAFIIFPLIILVIVAGFIYRYRWHLSHWLFLARARQLRISQLFSGTGFNVSSPSTGELPQKNYQYDAFVSYSNEDGAFVLKLVEELEENYPYLRLCVYERDFEIGTVISESIVQSVELSRCTVLILSDAFARSQWCMWELRMAQHRIFHDDGFGKSGAAFVLIRLGSVSDELLTPMLRYLIRTRIYLQWDPDPQKQHLFWHKLRAALSPAKLQNPRGIRGAPHDILKPDGATGKTNLKRQTQTENKNNLPDRYMSVTENKM
ncbi:toll-like receptor 4 [Hetaerina americana]|uniref:toll-like receptor 4 n=1 Tax=Hetaerina americana TaxID=62018 RepID=UPI003A7F41AB